MPRRRREPPDPIGTPPLAKGIVDRRALFACQTPQGFHWDVLRKAYGQADLTSTDDAQLVERLGEPVILVPGDPRNIKITRPTDLELARGVLASARSKLAPDSHGRE